MNGYSESISDKPVFRPLAEKTDRLEWLNERFGLFASVEQRLTGDGFAQAGSLSYPRGLFSLQLR